MFLHSMQLFRRDYPETFVVSQQEGLKKALQICN